MSDKVVRERTNYKNIYFNKSSKLYDVKYNYKEYDPVSQKNKYKAKWKYGLRTITEAKIELAKLQSGDYKEDTDITLKDVFELYKKEAEANNFSIITLRNTEEQLRMINKFLPIETKLKNISEDTYNFLIASCRKHGYSEETLYSINSCFRKLINLAYRKDLIKINILEKTNRKKFNVKLPVEENSPKIILPDEFKLIDEYYKDHSFIRLGLDRYKKYRLLFNFLYYSGCRIGETLVLTIKDFEVVGYKNNALVSNLENAQAQMFQVHIEKVILDNKKDIVRYSTKNLKNRVIPLPVDFMELFLDYLNYLTSKGVILSDDYRIFDFGQGNALTMLKSVIKKTGIRDHALHDFRHTFISNLINLGLSLAEVEKFSGDSQETIFKRYSHTTAGSKIKLLKVQDKFKESY